LSSPPKPITLPVKDYRRLPGEGISNITPELANEIRTAINRRDISLDLFQDMGESVPEFSLSLSINDQLDSSGEMIRQQLDISYDKQKNWRDSRIAFNNWREALEKYGVLVFQSSQLDPFVARGFSISEFPLPVIVVNRKDTYTGRIFTLLHEFAHILLRTSGVCEVDPDISLPPGEQKIEVFCNQISAETLMPRSVFYNEYQYMLQGSSHSELTDSKIEIIASKFGVSREAAVRRMLTLGLVSEKFYQDKRDQFINQYKKVGKSTGFVPPATDVISLAGKPYTRLVLSAFDTNKITSSDVSNFLGVRLKHLKEIGEIVGVR
jgi:Zn-dependent peptidase ImmA (M78 family)